MQLVLGGAEGDEGVVVAAELAHHVAQAEDGAEDQLGVVGAFVPARLSRSRFLVCCGGYGGVCAVGLLAVLVRGMRWRNRCRGLLQPLFRVDALGCEVENRLLADEASCLVGVVMWCCARVVVCLASSACLSGCVKRISHIASCHSGVDMAIGATYG